MHWIRSACAALPALLLPLSLPVLSFPVFAQNQQPPVPAQPPAPLTLPQPAGAPPVPAQAAPAHVEPRYLVVLDAAHGGGDTGARISDKVVEKDLTLALSVRLRSTLNAHGIGVVTTRESDVLIAPPARAGAANHAQAAACLLIHATATGSGVHLFTSSLAPAPYARFAPWQTAQAAYVTQSLKLSSDIDSALAHAQIPVTLGRASVAPIDNLTCPAVALEVAPLAAGNTTKAEPISDASYQKSVIDAITAALEQWRSDWRQQP
ncbi:N-acetylmuramoyl-L-alanine amidase family protein [Paracidobacterium acidisoli]|uniref:N-acetylmuramoyl-L-alanine amidase n=1 Tax=Paracidobacterium acidisoli TaxID=2303751 RepID=A0A372IKE3_9BACT|nr:N-acetylmuramoyl-L-alanine amidase [Paracidobacterium acidisoli]MBT9332768.1 N-acetylmuramoyl-L-alanine amidase [Paracidobacterium acidisoli]